MGNLRACLLFKYFICEVLVAVKSWIDEDQC